MSHQCSRTQAPADLTTTHQPTPAAAAVTMRGQGVAGTPSEAGFRRPHAGERCAHGMAMKTDTEVSQCVCVCHYTFGMFIVCLPVS